MEDLQERIDKANNKMINGDGPDAPQASQAAPQPVAPDYYQMSANAAYTASQSPTAYGSPAEMTQIVKGMVEDTKEHYYNAYNNRANHLADSNDQNGARQTAQQYMTQYALPLVESLVETYGVDALLNNKKALSELDSIMLTGNGAGDGYTESYLKQMHYQTLRSQGTSSDIELSRGLQKARELADSNDIRAAVAMSKTLKGRVDNGELSASPEDYETLMRVVNG